MPTFNFSKALRLFLALAILLSSLPSWHGAEMFSGKDATLRDAVLAMQDLAMDGEKTFPARFRELLAAMNALSGLGVIALPAAPAPGDQDGIVVVVSVKQGIYLPSSIFSLSEPPAASWLPDRQRSTHQSIDPLPPTPPPRLA